MSRRALLAPAFLFAAVPGAAVPAAAQNLTITCWARTQWNVRFYEVTEVK